MDAEDDNAPWPREYAVYGDITRELMADTPTIKYYMENMPDRFIAEHGLKRAPGSEWKFTWHGYTQKDIDRHNAFYFAMDVEAPFEVGDWHYRATALVVKAEE